MMPIITFFLVLVMMLQLQYVLSWSNSRSNRPITTRVPSSSYRLGLMLQQKLMFLQPPWQQQQSHQQLKKLSHNRVHDKFIMMHYMTTASSSDNDDSISEEQEDNDDISNGEEEKNEEETMIMEIANALTSEPSFGTTKQKQQQQEVVASSKTKENYLQLAREAYTKLGFNESNNNDNDVSLSEGEYLKKAEEAWMVANINAVPSDSAPFSSLPVTKTLATTIPNTTVPKSSNTLSMNKGMIGGIGVDKSKLMGAGARESFFTSQSKSMGSFFATTKSNTVPVNKGSESVSGKGIGLNKSIPLSEKKKLPNTTTVMPFGKSSSNSDTLKMKVGGGFKVGELPKVAKGITTSKGSSGGFMMKKFPPTKSASTSPFGKSITPVMKGDMKVIGGLPKIVSSETTNDGIGLKKETLSTTSSPFGKKSITPANVELGKGIPPAKGGLKVGGLPKVPTKTLQNIPPPPKMVGVLQSLGSKKKKGDNNMPPPPSKAVTSSSTTTKQFPKSPIIKGSEKSSPPISSSSDKKMDSILDTATSFLKGKAGISSQPKQQKQQSGFLSGLGKALFGGGETTKSSSDGDKDVPYGLRAGSPKTIEKKPIEPAVKKKDDILEKAPTEPSLKGGGITQKSKGTLPTPPPEVTATPKSTDGDIPNKVVIKGEEQTTKISESSSKRKALRTPNLITEGMTADEAEKIREARLSSETTVDSTSSDDKSADSTVSTVIADGATAEDAEAVRLERLKAADEVATKLKDEQPSTGDSTLPKQKKTSKPMVMEKIGDITAEEAEKIREARLSGTKLDLTEKAATPVAIEEGATAEEAEAAREARLNAADEMAMKLKTKESDVVGKDALKSSSPSMKGEESKKESSPSRVVRFGGCCCH